MQQYYTEEEYREVEKESIAHAMTIRKLRDSIEKAEEMLNDNVRDDGSISEGVRIEAVSILHNALQKHK